MNCTTFIYTVFLDNSRSTDASSFGLSGAGGVTMVDVPPGQTAVGRHAFDPTQTELFVWEAQASDIALFNPAQVCRGKTPSSAPHPSRHISASSRPSEPRAAEPSSAVTAGTGATASAAEGELARTGFEATVPLAVGASMLGVGVVLMTSAGRVGRTRRH